MTDLEQKILSLGMTFRSLSLHSDGRWIVKYRNGNKWSITQAYNPQEATQKAINSTRQVILESYE